MKKIYANSDKLRQAIVPLQYGFLLVVVALAGTVFRDSFNVSVLSVCRFWGFLSIMTLLAYYYFQKKHHGARNNPYNLFVLGAFVCWLGQVILICLNIKTQDKQIISGFVPNELFSSAMYVTLCLGLIGLAGLIILKGSTYDNHDNQNDDKILLKCVRYTGAILTLIGSYSFFNTKIINVQRAFDYGYGNIFGQQANSNTPGILSNISMFFIPGIILLLISYKKNPLKRALIMVPVVISIVLSFAAGGRGGALSIIIAIFWLYTVEFSIVTRRKLIPLIIVALLILGATNTLKEYRVAEVKNFQTFANIYKRDGIGQYAVIGALNEFGYNIFSTYYTMKIIPDQQAYAKGYTYLASALAILPSSAYGGHSFSQEAGLPDWLQRTLGLDYGPGYSIAAESYYNFGWNGLYAIFGVGAVLASFLRNTYIGQRKSLRNAFIAILLYTNLFIARDTSLMVFRKYAYTVLLPMVMIAIFYSIYGGRHSKEEKKEAS